MFRKRIGYVLYNLILLAVAFFFDRFFQMLMYVLFFNLMMNCFRYRFHASTIIKDNIKAVKYCKLITLCVEIVFMIFCKNLSASIYLNLCIIFSIALSNALIEFYAEKTIINVASLHDFEVLTRLCNEAKLTDNATKRMIMRYVERKSYDEIADIECVDPETIRKSILRSKKKLNII